MIVMTSRLVKWDLISTSYKSRWLAIWEKTRSKLKSCLTACPDLPKAAKSSVGFSSRVFGKRLQAQYPVLPWTRHAQPLISGRLAEGDAAGSLSLRPSSAIGNTDKEKETEK